VLFPKHGNKDGSYKLTTLFSFHIMLTAANDSNAYNIIGLFNIYHSLL